MRLWTERLELIAATPALLRAELAAPTQLAALLEVAVPQEWPPPLNTPETAQYALRFLEGGPDCAGWMTWYFVRQDGRVLVGQGGFCGRPKDGVVEVGYSLLPAHQARGYATEAVRALLAQAFSRPEVHTVSAQTFPHLTPSLRVLERLGFRPTGPGSEAGAVGFSLRRPYEGH